jgi:hypothetical protein
MKNWGSAKLHQEIVARLGTDAHDQTKIWPQKFKTADLLVRMLHAAGDRF